MDFIEEASKTIKTGNGFQNDLIVTTNHRLNVLVQAEVELTKEQKDTRKALATLESTIRSLDSKNEKVQKAIFWLTVVATVFASLQAVQILDIALRWLGK